MNRFQKIGRILFHLCFCAGFLFTFVLLNYFRPYSFYHPYKEWVIGIVILAACYLTYFWTTPKYYLNGFTKKFFIVSLVGCLSLTAFEMGFLWNDIMPFVKQRPDLLTLQLEQIIGMIFLRNCCLLGFFFILCTNSFYSAELRKARFQNIAHSLTYGIAVPKGSTVNVRISDIAYIHHQKNYSYFHLADGSNPRQYISLTKIMEEVPEGIFVRINKNTLVNRAYVIGVEKDMVMLNLTDPETGNAIKLTTSPNYQMDFDFKL